MSTAYDQRAQDRPAQELLTSCSPDALIEADVQLGPVPAHLAHPTAQGPVHECAPGRYLLTLPAVGRFLVQDGSRITIEPAPDAGVEDVRCFLQGPVREACWLQRGRFSLRAAAVEVDGSAVAMVGPAASGKSTTAGALALRGHPVLADGSLPVDPDDDRLATPTSAGIELWPRSADLLGLDPTTSTVVRPVLAKRLHGFPRSPGAALTTVVHLSRGSGTGAPERTVERGFAAVDRLLSATAMQPLIEPYGLGAAHVRWATGIARTARVVRLRTDRHRNDLARIADLVEQSVRTPRP
jgi:hypothetical protein